MVHIGLLQNFTNCLLFFVYHRVFYSLNSVWNKINGMILSHILAGFTRNDWSITWTKFTLKVSLHFLSIWAFFGQTAVCSSPRASLTLFLLLAVEAMLTVSLFLGFFRLDLRGLLMLAANRNNYSSLSWLVLTVAMQYYNEGEIYCQRDQHTFTLKTSRL